MKKRLNKLLYRLGYDRRRVRLPKSRDGRRVLHFLHLGKNAGTQIMGLSKQIKEKSDSVEIIRQRHDIYLKDLPADAEYFFSIRNPVSRFKSGFYSRKRKGQPRIYSEWTAYEAQAFADFEHANDLAEALFAEGELGRKAWAAAKSIRHNAQNQTDWFYLCGNFLALRPPVAIIRQENFDADVQTFLSRATPDLTLADLQVGKDSTSSHSNDYSGIPPLSDKAVANLERWYAQDLAFYAMCSDWMDAQS